MDIHHLTIISSAEASTDDNGQLRHIGTRHRADHFCSWGKYHYQVSFMERNSKHAIFSYATFLGFRTNHVAFDAR
jgi:hypothetical protein